MKPLPLPLDIVIFTCSGREQLLKRTLGSLDQALKRRARTILVVDGPFDLDAVDSFQLDLILKAPARSGYLTSIRRALELVKTPHFLWLEDDWDLRSLKCDGVGKAAEFLSKMPEYVQVRWPKDRRPNGAALTTEIMESIAGFSANPNLANTPAVVALFEELWTAQTAGVNLPANLGFETFCTAAMQQRGLRSAVFDYTHTGLVQHLGELESTERKWHFVAKHEPSTQAKPNRLSLLPRFVFYSTKVAIAIPFDRRMSEIAFRFVNLLRTERR